MGGLTTYKFITYREIIFYIGYLLEMRHHKYRDELKISCRADRGIASLSPEFAEEGEACCETSLRRRAKKWKKLGFGDVLMLLIDTFLSPHHSVI